MAIVTDPIERATILAKAGVKYNCRANVYRVNFTAGATDGEHSSPSHGAHRTPSPRPDSEHSSPSKRRNGEHSSPSSYPHSEHSSPSRRPDGEHRTPMMVNSVHSHGELSSPKLLNEKRESEPKSAPASAGTSGAGAPQEAKGSLNDEQASKRAPMPRPPKAPTLGAQPPGAAPANAYRPAPAPGDDDDHPFVDDGSTAHIARMLGKTTMHLVATNDDAVITEDDLPCTSGDRDRMAERAQQVVQQLAGRGGPLRMRAYAPGRLPQRTRDEQLDALEEPKRPRPAYAQGDVLLALRRAGGIPVPS
jgi:hypothetical protein